LFFALVPDDAVRREVVQIQRRLAGNGRVVSAPNLHVTLAFLGMQEATVIPQVCAVASKLTFEPCRVVLDRLGQFGRGSVLWLGVESLPDPLRDFQRSLVDALTAEGIGHDPKPWKFHLTLYRRLRKSPPKLDSIAIEWMLSGFELVESVGSKNGVEYHTLKHWHSVEKSPV